jgi:transposase
MQMHRATFRYVAHPPDDTLLLEQIEQFAGQAVIDLVVQTGAEAVLPPHQRAQQPRDDDRWWYRERHLVECFINKIKHFRRVFSRFDTLARRYLGFVQFTSVLIWLR